MSNPETFVTLSEETIAFLQACQIDGAVKIGYRSLRKGLLRNSSDDESWSEELDIPVYLNSIESLRFIGLEEDAAQIVLSRFNAAMTANTHAHPFSIRPVTIADLINFAIAYLQEKPNAYLPAHDWKSVLRVMGVDSSLRNGICDSRCDGIRYMKTARDWASESLMDNWTFIYGLDKQLKQ